MDPIASPLTRNRSRFLGFVSVVALVALAGSVATLLWMRDALPQDETGRPDYMPFVQEWEITGIEVESRIGTLEWHGCGEWEYSELDEAGVAFVSYGEGPPVGDESGCHIPSHWFRPLSSYRGNPSPNVRSIGPFEYEHAYTRDCSEVSNPVEPDNPLGPNFCSSPDDTFEDRVGVEFDPDTEVPMRYSQYVDGVITFEHRAISLRVLGGGEIRALPTSDGRDPDRGSLATATATP